MIPQFARSGVDRSSDSVIIVGPKVPVGVQRLPQQALNEMGVGNVEWVTGPQFVANTRIIGASSLIEAYEVQKGLLRVEKPSSLTVELAFAGYTAFWARHEGFVQLGTDPTP